jgi:hypothetical protein
MIAEVPVFEILPPRSPKELAEAGISKAGPPLAGTTAAAAITRQASPFRIFPPFAREAYLLIGAGILPAHV